jgi:Zn-dependent protease with chaperone function
VLTDDDAADAYTLPGWPCRVVVTAGMMRALSPAEREVLLAHERAHAAGFHFLFSTATRLAAAANPLLRPMAAAVVYTVERWADEHAAAATGDRPLAARAVARAALATKASPPPSPAIAATMPAVAVAVAVAVAAAAPAGLPGQRRFGIPFRQVGPIPRRVAALLNPPPRPRWLLMATVALVVLVAGASAVEAAHDLHALIEYARGTAT